ncbi:hypothetical protein ACFO4O_07765 [Glaciecola siphonariae]|uniref:Uncharacterized protein n=1 Tax=Glaciecola siphonariae TaxID=521012 RepID=A0ABV9LU69_9ALTE
MTSDEFIAHCRNEIMITYQAIKDGKPDDKQKYRTEGLIHAAKLLGLLSSKEQKDLIEDVHMQYFGESVAERRARKKSISDLKEQSPEAYFDIPAIVRKT